MRATRATGARGGWMRLNFDIELLTRRERDRRRYDGECVVKTCETTDEKNTPTRARRVYADDQRDSIFRIG